MAGFGVGCFEDIDMETNQKLYDPKEHAMARSSVSTGIQLFTMVLEIFFFYRRHNYWHLRLQKSRLAVLLLHAVNYVILSNILNFSKPYLH